MQLPDTVIFTQCLQKIKRAVKGSLYGRMNVIAASINSNANKTDINAVKNLKSLPNVLCVFLYPALELFLLLRFPKLSILDT